MKKEEESIEKIDWEEVKSKKHKEKPEAKKEFDGEIETKPEQKQEVSEERLAQIMADVEAGSKKEISQYEKRLAEKDEVKEELKRKYEKSKLRPANFITFIFLTIAGLVLVAELLILVWFLLKGLVNSTSGLEKIFGSNESIGSVLAGFGYIIYYLILITGLVVASGVIYLAVMSILDTAKLNFLKDEDYMMNIYIDRITIRDTLPLIPIDVILIFVMPFLGPTTFLQFVIFANIPLAVIHLGCLISIFVQSIVARIRVKKTTPEDKYKEMVSEKRRLQRLYMRRRRSSGSGNLY